MTLPSCHFCGERDCVLGRVLTDHGGVYYMGNGRKGKHISVCSDCDRLYTIEEVEVG